MYFLVLSSFLFILLMAAAYRLLVLEKRARDQESRAGHLARELQDRKVQALDFQMEAFRWREESRWKDLLLRRTAQELRERIQSLGSLTEVLMEQGERGVSKDLELLGRSLRSFSDTAALLLEYSRFTDPLFLLDLRPVDLESLARELSAEFSAQGEPLYLDVEVPCLKPVSADPQKIRQVLRSLVETAGRILPEGRVSVAGRYAPGDPSSVDVMIKAGIKNDAGSLSLWLEVWNKAEGHGEDAGAWDLGLPIARKLVALHGSHLDVGLSEEGGVEISFSLPVADSPPLAQDESLPYLPALEERSPLHPVREPVILMVDDDPVNLHLMSRNLTSGGCRSVPVDSGEKALELLGDGLRPNLVVLDLLMPGMGGLETLRTLRKTYPAESLPVLLLTAKNQVSDIVDGFEAGANDFITKPVGRRELLARIKTHLQLTGMAQAYGRFVPPQLLRLLNKESVLDLELGDFHQRTMTVLFCDLRNFTSLSETLTSRETFKFINSFFAAMSPAVAGNRGYVDKYLGDGFMALFPGEPEDGLSAAMEMQDRLKELNRNRIDRGRVPLEMGVGVHTGEVILGVVGSEGRMEGTVISDAVNLASRLESQTMTYGCHILVSRDALFAAKDITRYSYRFLGNEFLKGKQMSVAIYELFKNDGTPLNTWKQASKDRFEESLLLFSRGQLEEAQKLLQRLHDEFPGDRVIASFLSRCRRG